MLCWWTCFATLFCYAVARPLFLSLSEGFFFACGMASFIVQLIGALRLLAFITSVVVSCTCLTLLAPLKLLDPVLCKLVPLDYLPSNLAWVAFGVMIRYASGLHIVTIFKGKSIPRASILMYNHTTTFDPFLIQGSSGVCPKYIYKKEIHMIPFVGWCLWLYGNISIDRSNREKAIASIDAGVARIVNTHERVAIAPEGTRSKNGELQEFKKGPFHLAIKSKAAIVPVVIRNASRVWPLHCLTLRPGTIYVSYMDAIPVSETDDLPTLTAKVHKVFETELDSLNKLPPTDPVREAVLLGLVFLWHATFWPLLWWGVTSLR